jgi:hypothetical protein
MPQADVRRWSTGAFAILLVKNQLQPDAQIEMVDEAERWKIEHVLAEWIWTSFLVNSQATIRQSSS